MSEIRSIKNQYLGINAHLHSTYQAQGGWVEFHNAYINDLLRLMQRQLLPMGYRVGMEQSLQIRRDGFPLRTPKSDLTIFDPRPSVLSSPAAFTALPLSGDLPLVLDLPDILDDDLTNDFYPALAIYELQTPDDGNPIVWIEVLSPSNKISWQDGETYASKRFDLLRTGITYLEIDYLHESPPTFEKLIDVGLLHYKYPQHTVSPYRIIVIVPHPTMQSGKAYWYPFHVDSPIPTVQIPLSSDDLLRCDFDSAYQKTLQETAYGLFKVDYAQLPLNFERYTPADQARIANRMVAVLHATHEGVDLETAPFPVETLALDDALKQIEQLRGE